ncbi:hypothetical protein ACCO45_012904 [Purpureocillium lilacinum]|uniref:Uncharacterized protein n=1 Tax=Purpureocillium lilacinum TaxID=33203 RepID=A0ACC4DBW5_PURLI
MSRNLICRMSARPMFPGKTALAWSHHRLEAAIPHPFGSVKSSGDGSRAQRRVDSPLGPPVASRTLQSPIAVSGAYPAPFGYDSSPPAVYPSVYGDGAGVLLPGYDESLYNPQIPSNTVRNSLSPQLAVGPSSETLVTAPAALAPDRVISPMLCGRQPDTAFGFLMAGDLIHVPLSREARNEIPVYIDKYWEKVHPLYPIIHRPSFEDASGVDSQHHDILRCAMAAVATQFLEHKEHRINGSQLHAHALHECKRIPQSNWSLSIMQALLLCEHYAQFRGRSKEAYLPSAQFNALCQMVANSQFALDSVTLGCDNFQRWRSWTHLESCRRILSACFLLSVHGIWYYEQPVTSFLGLDNFSPMMLSIPLSAGTKKAWEAETADSWASIDFSTVKSRTVGDAMQEQLSPAMIESMPRFDSSLLLAAHALQLPRRRNPTEVDIFQDASCIKPHDMVIPTLFQHSPGGYTYLALHYTPLQCLLSVSGDSWILNNKVSHPSIFIDHKMKLQKWRRSGNAAAATVFAAKALRIFLNLGPNAFGHNDVLLAGQKRSLPSWTDISDFWGVYVCALICWAFGYEGKRNPSKSSRGAAVGWLLTVSELEPGDLQNLTGREESQGVVGLIHDVLGRDCLGGRNILYADAVRVLRKLEEVDNWAWI